MGCRCCKMIQSYIFDPQDVQSSGYVSEISNYKPDEQDGGKFKCKQNNDIRPHKEQLQNSELQQAANRHKLNKTTDAVQNHRSSSFHEEGLGNFVGKCNGIHSYPNPSTNQNGESSSHTSFEQLSDSSAERLSQPYACDNHEIHKNEVYPKLPSETTEHFHYEESQNIGEKISCCPSDISDMQGGTRPPESNYAKKLISAGSKTTSNHIHTDQSTKCTAGTNHSIDLPLLDSGDKAPKGGLLNACFKDKTSNDALYPQDMMNVEQESTSGGHEGVNGGLEEEDAEVAEALAALEAATAGEDSEEEENY